jgi:hypothetical protein
MPIEFNVSMTIPTIISKDNNKSGFVFKFKNLTEKTITILWYKFTFYRDGIITDDYPVHEFLFEIPAGEEKEKVFGQVDVPNYYLSGDAQPGIFRIVVAIRYFVQGESVSKKITSETELTII